MIKVNLLALTGFGNEALKSLLKYKKEVNILGLHTREENGRFPYYDEEDIRELARRYGIKTYLVPRSGAWSIKSKADINLTATFHRILKEKHLQKARYNINIHPSLLPSYKGSTPTNWMIHNKEKLCGLTAYLLTGEIDSGDIIYQKAYTLCADSDPALRRYLAERVGSAVNYLIDSFPNYHKIESPYEESRYPHFYNTKNKKNINE